MSNEILRKYIDIINEHETVKENAFLGTLVAAIPGILMLGTDAPGVVKTVIASLGVALGIFITSISNDTAHQKQQQYQHGKFSEGKKFAVYMNGVKRSDDENQWDHNTGTNAPAKYDWGKFKDDLYTAEEAVQKIKELASLQHDPKTYFSIKNVEENKVVWRFTITDGTPNVDNLKGQ